MIAIPLGAADPTNVDDLHRAAVVVSIVGAAALAYLHEEARQIEADFRAHRIHHRDEALRASRGWEDALDSAVIFDSACRDSAVGGAA